MDCLFISFSTTNAIPDDLSIITIPRGQVDYLSHNWQEEDVWRSWRTMTKQKNEIANGMRLENASWRTWWKQRNKLKTVTPETLNWLKDSDVTWLYGPLHTAVDWSPPPRPKPAPPNDTNSTPDRLDFKPILKHRSISQLLTSDLPSPLFTPADSDEDEPVTNSLLAQLGRPDKPPRKKPPLLHTKSDTHIVRCSTIRPRRKPSPSFAVTDYAPPHSNSNLTSYFHPASTSRSPSTSTHSNDRDSSPLHSSPLASASTGKKKHISFNTFVEQCIAIEKPKKSFSFRKLDPSDRGQADDITLWNRRKHLDSDSDGQEEDDDDDDDDDVLEMRTPSNFVSKARSKSKASSASSSSSSSSDPTRYRPPLIRTNSVDREHVSIAPIAPTILKTTDIDDDLYSWPGSSPSDSNDANAVYDRDRKDSGGRTPVELVYVPPLGSNYQVQPEDGDIYHSDSFLNFGALVSPPHPIAKETEEASDYFHGPDLRDDLPTSSRKGQVVDDPVNGPRPNPEVVVNGGSTELVTRAPSRSRSRTPSPAEFPPSSIVTSPKSSSLPVPRPRGRSASYSPPVLLSPPTRGRSTVPQRSVSATQLGCDSQPQTRGRSSTRTSSSVSERERSNRGSAVSPDAPLSLGVGIFGGRSIYGRDRGRSDSGGERGRERTERRLSGSRSPDNVNGGATEWRQQSLSSSFSTVSSTETVMPSCTDSRSQDIMATTPILETTTTITTTISSYTSAFERSDRKEAEPPKSRNPTPAHPTHTSRSSISSLLTPPVSPTAGPISPTLSSSPVSVPRAHTSRVPLVTTPPVTMLNRRNSAGGGLCSGLSDGHGHGYAHDAEHAGLVGRLVSSAGLYLGLWHSSAT